MNKDKLTPWFYDCQPKRAGPYIAEFGGMKPEPPLFFNFTNGIWSAGAYTPEGAMKRPAGVSNRPDRWRGLSSPPKQQKDAQQPPKETSK